MKGLLLLLAICSVITLNDAAKAQRKITLRGRVIFPDGSHIPVETGGILTVELQDTSLQDAGAKVISKSVGQAIRFPMAFAIKYQPEELPEGMIYSLRVRIVNKNNELLYTNDVHVGVKLHGEERTKLVDVPVILVKKPPKNPFRGKWFELLGMDGAEAVEIVKKETGFKNVVTIPEGSAVTMDYRTDRVRIFVNKNGKVARVPTIA